MLELPIRDDLRIRARRDLGVATIMARKGVSGAAIGEALGLDAPTTPRASTKDGLSLLGYGPDVWLAVRDDAPADWDLALEQRMEGLASVSDQSGSYLIYRFEGAATRTFLSRGAFIDFNPDVLGANAVALTVIAHIGVIIWARGDDVFDVAIFRSYEASFRHWIETAARGLDHGAR